MALRLVGPEEGILDPLVTEIAGCVEALFVAAYLDLPTATRLAAAIEARHAAAPALAVRVLVRTSDHVTAPAALRRLSTPALRGVVELRTSSHAKLHAKAFGFRAAAGAEPVVWLGSANLTRAAMAADSGELGVRIERGALAHEAWDALEDFWRGGVAIEPAWLAVYRDRVAQLEALREPARARERAWRAAPVRFRVAELADIPTLMAIRNAVRENRLRTLVLSHADYAEALTVDGRAWVAEEGGAIVGFVCGRPARGDIWALFLRASHEGRGIGSALMAIVEDWMFAEGLEAIRLDTEPGTRAEALYLRRGWIRSGTQPTGEAAFRLPRPRGD
jgi:GNAT superfamily N-acetyltransferase/HKD family nuclease